MPFAASARAPGAMSGGGGVAAIAAGISAFAQFGVALGAVAGAADAAGVDRTATATPCPFAPRSVGLRAVGAALGAGDADGGGVGVGMTRATCIGWNTRTF